MIRLLFTGAVFLVANGIGLLLAIWLLPGFRIDALSFLLAVLIFSGVQILVGPLLTKMSFKSMPQIMGSVALITSFLGLLVTDFLMQAMSIGGISNLLAATLLVWLGSLIAAILLPVLVFKRARASGGGAG